MEGWGGCQYRSGLLGWGVRFHMSGKLWSDTSAAGWQGALGIARLHLIHLRVPAHCESLTWLWWALSSGVYVCPICHWSNPTRAEKANGSPKVGVPSTRAQLALEGSSQLVTAEAPSWSPGWGGRGREACDQLSPMWCKQKCHRLQPSQGSQEVGALSPLSFRTTGCGLWSLRGS